LNPTISIIIPTYNALEHLKHWENKNRPEKFKFIEFIFIDSNSNDGSCSYFLHLVEKYNNVFFYNLKSSIYEAMNFGVKKSNSEWILFMGVDDYLLVNCSELLNHLNTDDLNFYDLLIVNYQISFQRKLFLKNSKNQIGYPHHQSCIFNKLTLLNLDYIYDTKFKLFSDMDLIFRILKNKKILYLPYNCVNFSKGGKSTNGQNFNQTIKELTFIAYRHNKIFTKFYILSVLRLLFYYSRNTIGLNA
jgi:glycosyltransferase involved in cell wall biosynthesis